MATVILESINGAWKTTAGLPNGKPLIFEFKEAVKGDGHFVCEVPTEITYVDDFQQTKVFHKNYAQHLVNAYPHNVRIVEAKPAPIVETPIITPAKKEKKREKVLV